jgi:hypothetical protein
MKHKLQLLPALLLPLAMFGCAGTDWGQVESDVLTDVKDGTTLASEVFAAYTAVNQNLTTANVTTGKLDLSKVLAAAVAVNGGLETPGLKEAVAQFVADANQTITDLKGSSTQSVINTISQDGAATVTAVAATQTAVTQ